METRNDIPNLLAMYIRNTSEIYNLINQKKQYNYDTIYY